VLAKAGTHSWAYLSDNTVANATGYFDLAACATGTKGAGAREIFAWDYGGGWCLIGLSFTGTAASHTFALQVADADLDKTTSGNGSAVAAYFSEMQLERADLPTSRMATTTGAVARSADVLQYNAAGNALNSRGSVVCDLTIPDHQSGAFLRFATIDAESDGDSVIVGATNAEFPALEVRSGGVLQANIVGTTDISDGVLRSLAGSWTANDFRLFVNGAPEGTPDTAGSVPATFTRIHVGQLGVGGGIRRCRIWDRAGVTR
jgi:hypothetical protein